MVPHRALSHDPRILLMSKGTDYDGGLNGREWPGFDWVLEPVQAFLALRAKGRVSPCEDDAGGGASEEN